jgi:2,4-dienoyl-CoA reductase-like NADH-dependent reductase (Old Yellow Enzyme family)
LAETKIKLTRKEKGAKEKMQTTRTEALSLYRELQRCSRQFPYEQARKQLSLNVRELFLLRRGVTSNSQIRSLLDEGRHDLIVMKRFALLDPEVVATIFNFNPSSSDAPPAQEQ